LVRFFLSVIGGRNHQLADHALHVVKEDVAVEQPTTHCAAKGHAVSERAVIQSNPEGKRVIGQQIDGVPELPVGPRVDGAGYGPWRAHPRLNFDRLKGEAV
jgi:hypothetical protein